MKLLKQLLIRSNLLFDDLESIDHQRIRMLVLGLLFLEISVSTYSNDEEIALIIFGTIVTVLFIYLFLSHIIPFILKTISSWMGGISSKTESERVLYLSFIPLSVGAALSAISEQMNHFVNTSEFAYFLLYCVALKVLVLGISRANKFSIKESAMTLITLSSFSYIIAILLGR